MRTKSVFFAFALFALLLSGTTASAQVSVRIGGGYYPPRPVYYGPRYYPPQPVIVAPPVYYAPRPVYYAPRYYAPRPVYYGPRHGYGRGGGRRW